MSDVDKGSLSYFLDGACDRQWHAFLAGIAGELSDSRSPADLRTLFLAVGRRMARSSPFSGGTLRDLELHVNAHCAQVRWGLCRFSEHQDHIEIVHSASPLRAAFGAAALTWTPAILEGMYTEWLNMAGAGGGLRLYQVGGVEGAADSVRFRLAAAAGSH